MGTHALERMATGVKLSPTAHAGIVFHAFKFPHCAVCGVLVGTPGSGGSKIDVQFSVPIAHGQTTLAPMLEMALAQAEAYAEQQGASIVGYYCANEFISNNNMIGDFKDASVGRKIGDSIRERCKGDTCMLLVDNEAL